MDPCDFADIETRFDAAVQAVAAEQGVDPVCSSSNWILPLAAAFAPRAQHRVFASDAGMAAFLEHDTANGPVFSSFDSVWGFATPLIAADPESLIEAFAPVLADLDWSAVTISGLDPAGPLFDQVQRLSPAGYTDTADRCVVDLTDGFDAWLGRRSSRFRRSLRAAVHRAARAGVTVEDLTPDTPETVQAAFDRILAIEKTSWKTDARSGLLGTPLGRFTRFMADRFGECGSLHVQFARLDETDIGYVIGATVGDRYRGFQHSFDNRLRDLSIGKVLQHHTIHYIAMSGAHIYDMGMHMGYKVSYADRIESTVTAVIARP